MTQERATMNTKEASIAGATAGVVAVMGVIVGIVAGGPAAAQLNVAAEARVTLLARGYNATGQQLFGQFATAPGNIVLSPYSIGTAETTAWN
jgi:hypothetical protein